MVTPQGMGAVGMTVREVAQMAPALREAQRLNREDETVLIDVDIEGRRSRWDR